MSCLGCEFDPCRCPGKFTVLDPISASKTLLRSMVPCVDQVRDLYTSLGMRSYEVALVHTQWSGGERGAGQESVVREELLLPTPLVTGVDGLSRSQQSFGGMEEGSVTVSQISARFSEDYLRGLGVGGTSVPSDQNFYYEVRAISVDGAVDRRRFFPTAVPVLDMGKLQWTVKLTKAAEDRGRARGEPR